MELLLISLLVAVLVLFFSGWRILKAILSATFTLTLAVICLYLLFKFLLLILSAMPFIFLIVVGVVIGILIDSGFRDFVQKKISSML